jgi:hypothetical protein
MDIKYPLSVLNGDIQLTAEDETTRSQFLSYINCEQSESILEPSYGRVTSPQSSTYRSVQLVAQLEKINADLFFDDIDYSVDVRYVATDRRLVLQFTESA